MRFDPDRILADHEQFVVTRRALVPVIPGFVWLRSALARPYDLAAGALILAGIVLQRIGQEVSGQPVGRVDIKPGWAVDPKTRAYRFYGLPETDAAHVARLAAYYRQRPANFELVTRPQLRAAIEAVWSQEDAR